MGGDEDPDTGRCRAHTGPLGCRSRGRAWSGAPTACPREAGAEGGRSPLPVVPPLPPARGLSFSAFFQEPCLVTGMAQAQVPRLRALTCLRIGCEVSHVKPDFPHASGCFPRDCAELTPRSAFLCCEGLTLCLEAGACLWPACTHVCNATVSGDTARRWPRECRAQGLRYGSCSRGPGVCAQSCGGGVSAAVNSGPQGIHTDGASFAEGGRWSVFLICT